MVKYPIEKGLHCQGISTQKDSAQFKLDLSGVELAMMPFPVKKNTSPFIAITKDEPTVPTVVVELENGEFGVIILWEEGNEFYVSPSDEINQLIRCSETEPSLRNGKDASSRRLCVIKDGKLMLLLIHLNTGDRVRDRIVYPIPP